MESTIHDDILEQQENERSIADKTSANSAKRFRWDKDDKVINLIRCLANYKSQMEFNNCDFNADKVKLYEAVRIAMAKIYQSDPSQFGPSSLVSSSLFSTKDDSLTEEERLEKHKLKEQHEQEKKLIKKGYQRIHEKLKEIRQNFSIAVTTGRRSGSGKIVMQYYDELVKIWGGSPATAPLSCGTSTEAINNPDNFDEQDIDCDKDSVTKVYNCCYTQHLYFFIVFIYFISFIYKLYFVA